MDELMALLSVRVVLNVQSRISEGPTARSFVTEESESMTLAPMAVPLASRKWKAPVSRHSRTSTAKNDEGSPCLNMSLIPETTIEMASRIQKSRSAASLMGCA